MCLNLCGLPVPPSENELAEAFLTTVPKRFEFWSGQAALWNLTDDQLESAETETVRYPFRCTMSFPQVEVTYGDRDYAASVIIHDKRLENWLQAIDDEHTLPDYRFLHSPARMDEYLTAAAASIIRVWDQLSNPTTALTSAAAAFANDLARHERLDRAAAAFGEKDYGRVVELLGPLDGDLFKSDQKRLERARKKQRQSGRRGAQDL